MSKRLLLSFCVGAGALLATDGGWAQTGAGASAANTPAPRPEAAQTQSRSDAGQSAVPTRQDINASSTSAIEQVVVTASSRAQKLQRVPAAVTAFTDVRRNLLGIETGRDVANLTPSVNLQGEFLSIRGVGRYEDPGQGVDPGTAVYVDGVYTSSPAYLNQPDFLTDRIEVLRGPQSVFGRNEIAGALDEYSKRPTDELHGDLRAGGTSLAEGYAEAGVSGPLTDQLRYRFAYAFSDTGDGNGPQTNQAPDRANPSTGLTRLYQEQLDWTPVDKLDVWVSAQQFSSNLTGDYGVQTGIGGGFNQLSPYLTDRPANFFSAASSFYGLAPNPQFGLPGNRNPSLRDRLAVSLDDPGNTNLRNNDTFTTITTYDFGWATLKYIGGYSQYDFAAGLDADDTDRRFFTSPYGIKTPSYYTYDSTQDKKWFSNELVLTSNAAGPLRWIAGLYQYQEQYRTDFSVRIPGEASLADPIFSTTSLAAPPNPTRAFYDQVTHLRTESQAAYGRVDYDLTSRITLTGDMRYNWDQKYGGNSFREIYDIAGFYGPYVPQHGLDVTPAQHSISAARDFRDWSGKIQLDWKPDATTLAYAEIAKGYKPGGFNLAAFNPIPVLQQETLIDYEVGLKKTFGTILLVNAAAYYYAYHNLQLPITEGIPVRNPVTGQTSELFAASAANARSSRSTGFELESVWTPVPDVHLTFVYSLQDAEITDFTSATPGGLIHDPVSGRNYTNLRGDQLPQAPRDKFSLIPQYVSHFASGDLSLSALFTWTDRQYFGVFDVPGYRAPSSYNLDLRAVYQPSRSHWTAIAYIRNVGDSLQYLYYGPSSFSTGAAGPFPSQQTFYTLSEPRTVGAELQYRF